ncbi:MAG: hypothetical protein K2O42_10555, partial [Oscillospiraceae bacterium]|nr:hypothetical protein [Oscillospiraceae bacterium]
DITDVRIYPYEAYTDQLIEKHYVPYALGGSAKTWDRETIDTIIAENVPAQFLSTPIAEPTEAESESGSEQDF